MDNLQTIDQIKDEVYGKVGTEKRDALERELDAFAVGLMLRQARESKRLTQEQLAGSVNKKRAYISRIENDGGQLTLKALHDIVEKGWAARSASRWSSDGSFARPCRNGRTKTKTINMNFTKSIVCSLLMVAGMTAFAQNSNLRKAKSGLQKFEELKSAGSPELGRKLLEEAREPMDKALAHDKTKDNPETWTIHALIHANFALLDKSAEEAAKAEEAIQKAKELDKDGKNADNLTIAGQLLGQFNFDQGVAAWEKQDFTAAYDAFDLALTFLPGDTTLTYYAGLAAIQNKDYPKAVDKYMQLLPVEEFSLRRTVVIDLPKLYLSASDTASAIEYAARAAREFPEDDDAVIQNIELNLIVGNETAMIAEIEGQTVKDPNNASLFYYLGIAQFAANNADKALEAYRKAIAIDPDYADANKNISAIIINGIRDELNALNEDRTVSNNDYNTKLGELKERIKEALPHLQKVVEINPQDIDALRSLKGYYDFLQDEEKSKEVQAKIEAL